MSTKNVIVDEVPNMQKRTPLSKPYTERSLHDSGFISPPTQVKFEPDTPCHYFLRGGNFRWSSTPLPVAECFNTPFSRSNSSPSVLAASTPQSIDVLDFQTRLKNIGEGESPFEDTVTSASDSGFESITSSTIETSATGEVSSLQSRIDGRDNIGHVVGDEGNRLGAIPKRRSPRHLALGNKVDGIERLTRIKTEKRNLNVEQEEGKLLTAVRSRFSMPDFDKFSIKKNLVKPPSQASKEGREICDILRYIYEKNISHVLGIIYSCLAPKDLCQVAQVSQLWNLAISSVKVHNERRLNFVTVMRVNQENFGNKVGLVSKLVSPRRVMQEVANINHLSPNGGKRDRNPSSSTLTSPSKIRHKLFLEEARKLSPCERLAHCPLCRSPSRVYIPPTSTLSSSCPNLQLQKAECSSPKCSFVFCPHCQCEHHAGRSCRVTRTGSKAPKSGTVTSKKSKARLRRL